MIVTGNWLREYINPAPTNEELLELLPLIGLELEETHDLPNGDYLFNIAILANRPDCLGVIGIAREIAAFMKRDLVLSTVSLDESGMPAADQVAVEIEYTQGCPRYMARLIRGVKVASSPQWLVDRLVQTGSRAINNVVDVTNYVMRETSQPLHAFDFAKVGGSKIVVRRMKADETLTLLDGTKLKPRVTPLAICDANIPVALAGIMGGLDSETTDATTDVLLEAAYFDPVDVRKSARSLGLATEASYRFERGMDPNVTVSLALDRAAQLIAELGDGQVAPGVVDAYPTLIEPNKHVLDPEKVSQFLGMTVSAQEIADSLTRLGATVSINHQPSTINVSAATWRVDATHKVALIEDVARMVGYSRAPSGGPRTGDTPGKESALSILRRDLLALLTSLGFQEGRNVPMVTVSEDDACRFAPCGTRPVAITNPISAEMAGMRVSLLPSVISAAAMQVRRGLDIGRHFEIDRTFRVEPPDTFETWSLAAVIGGAAIDTDWSGKSGAAGFWHLKGVLESVLERAGVGQIEFIQGSRPGFRAGRCAEVRANGISLGLIGEIDESVLGEHKLAGPVFGYEVDLQAILANGDRSPAFKKPSRMPAVNRDIAVIVPERVQYAKLEATVALACGELLEDLRCVDLYQGKHIDAGHKSVAIRMRLRAADRTLTTEEANEAISRVIEALQREYGARLRS